MSKNFEATSEWQPVGADQAIPPGCHVRVNMQTGEREARLLSKDEPSENTQMVAADPR